ncbi:DUF4258 domain-containing protein [Flagellimonas sp. HMM57]|uniref:DUF4258 domain-containing protein n=1 Tax=unclassified Flagellimonas TaxID=2644544 RepID=UPI0013D89BA9|nr:MULTISPECIES: DUF4258 domain-containing protein [unclassified Flagellimonas]UII75934.1 DUF4258 domain-containing protein [Flagellimonas sp. HMM57]
MAFLKRLGWYLVGLSIGIVFLVFFLKKKSGESGIDFCYFPNCRVLKDMRSKPLVFSGSIGKTAKDSLLIRSFLTDGDIDFGKSDTKSKPCKTYFIEYEVDEEDWILEAKSCNQQVRIETLEKAK